MMTTSRWKIFVNYTNYAGRYALFAHSINWNKIGRGGLSISFIAISFQFIFQQNELKTYNSYASSALYVYVPSTYMTNWWKCWKIELNVNKNEKFINLQHRRWHSNFDIQYTRGLLCFFQFWVVVQSTNRACVCVTRIANHPERNEKLEHSAFLWMCRETPAQHTQHDVRKMYKNLCMRRPHLISHFGLYNRVRWTNVWANATENRKAFKATHFFLFL